MSSPLMHDPHGEQSAALFAAIEQGDVDRVPELIDRGADVNARRADGWTPLMAAANKGQPDVVRELLATGADPNARTLEGWTPLLAGIDGGNEEVVLTILEEHRAANGAIRPGAPLPTDLAAVASGPRQRH